MTTALTKTLPPVQARLIVEAMNDVRCGDCRRKLAVGVFTRLAIKCPRCGVLNSFTERRGDLPQGAPTLERHERQSLKGTDHERQTKEAKPV
jgi:phage FluMu protein Com